MRVESWESRRREGEVCKQEQQRTNDARGAISIERDSWKQHPRARPNYPTRAPLLSFILSLPSTYRTIRFISIRFCLACVCVVYRAGTTDAQRSGITTRSVARRRSNHTPMIESWSRLVRLVGWVSWLRRVGLASSGRNRAAIDWAQ